MAHDAITVGDRVRCFVNGTPMHIGIVTEVRDGYYMVDRMSLHGGAPWICYERHVRKEPAEGNDSTRDTSPPKWGQGRALSDREKG
ncbi:hypothetical protein CMI37_29670 [Candidatus Pacearchaeota archaeon]|nr:hypothetical protein [Candidatus Pacearchaeota archaeon]